jgi:hypothetical protein
MSRRSVANTVRTTACLVLTGLAVLGLAAGSFGANAPVTSKKRFEPVEWPKDGKPGGFTGSCRLAELDRASAEIILLMAPPRSRPHKEVQPGKEVRLKTAADACRHLTHHLNMAAGPAYVAVYSGRPKTRYIFSGRTNARSVGDFSSGVVLAQDGHMTFYELDWSFFDKLHALLGTEAPRPHRPFARGIRKIPAKLDKLLADVKDPELRERCRKFVDLWKALISLRAYGDVCSRPCVFEWHLRLLLETETHRNAPHRAAQAADLRRRAWGATAWLYRIENGTAEPPKLDLPNFRHYLMSAQPHEWCRTARCVAGGVLAGEGDPAGIRVLLDAARRTLGKSRAEGFSAWALNEAARGAQTKQALPLWRAALKDRDEKIRDWAASQIRRIEGRR